MEPTCSSVDFLDEVERLSSHPQPHVREIKKKMFRESSDFTGSESCDGRQMVSQVKRKHQRTTEIHDLEDLSVPWPSRMVSASPLGRTSLSEACSHSVISTPAVTPCLCCWSRACLLPSSWIGALQSWASLQDGILWDMCKASTWLQTGVLGQMTSSWRISSAQGDSIFLHPGQLSSHVTWPQLAYYVIPCLLCYD